MSTATALKISEQDYLAGEEHAEVKHEYINGQVFAMTGTTDDHNVISGSLYVALYQHLSDGSCTPYIADVMVKASSNFFYPDLMVVCEPDPSDTSRLKHAPAVVVEVLSPSTRKRDITSKKVAYLNLPSLQEYIMIEQDKCEVQVFRRKDNWASTYYVLGDIITLDSIDFSISVEQIYERVENEDMTAYLNEKGGDLDMSAANPVAGL